MSLVLSDAQLDHLDPGERPASRLAHRHPPRRQHPPPPFPRRTHRLPASMRSRAHRLPGTTQGPAPGPLRPQALLRPGSRPPGLPLLMYAHPGRLPLSVSPSLQGNPGVTSRPVGQVASEVRAVDLPDPAASFFPVSEASIFFRGRSSTAYQSGIPDFAPFRTPPGNGAWKSGISDSTHPGCACRSIAVDPGISQNHAFDPAHHSQT